MQHVIRKDKFKKSKSPILEDYDVLSHSIALDPTYRQRTMLAMAAGCARFAYNWALCEWNKQYELGLKPNANKLKKQFNKIKRQQFPWICESPKDANQQSFSDLGEAFSSFFKSLKSGNRKTNHPSFRKKWKSDSFYISNDKFFLNKKSIYIPRIGHVRMKEAMRLNGKILGARIIRHANKWYASIQVYGNFEKTQNVQKRKVIGIDLGIKISIMPSAGDPQKSPEPMKSNIDKISRLHKSLSRKKKGSKNRHKTQMKLARIYRHVSNIRRDWVHKITTKLIRENQTVVIEDLDVRNMLLDKRFSKYMNDVGFGMIQRFLEYKSHLYRGRLIIADKWFPSSKRCNVCGNIKDKLELSTRIYVCDKCGTIEDRDRNAALNLEMYPGLQGNIAIWQNA